MRYSVKRCILCENNPETFFPLGRPEEIFAGLPIFSLSIGNAVFYVESRPTNSAFIAWFGCRSDCQSLIANPCGVSCLFLKLRRKCEFASLSPPLLPPFFFLSFHFACVQNYENRFFSKERHGFCKMCSPTNLPTFPYFLLLFLRHCRFLHSHVLYRLPI